MDNKVIVITGASAGIGAALARMLGARGDRVLLAARRAPELQAVAASSGKDALAVVADVTRRADVERIRDEALAHFGHIDVWVNNAGRGIARKVEDLTDDDIDRMMSVNVKSALYGMQAALAHFKHRGRGHIINISSMLGRVPYVPIRSAYNAAKHALNALTANLRMDLKASHPSIAVSLVMPGPVDTEFAANVVGAENHPGFKPPPGQAPEAVADAIVRVIDHPVAEVFTFPGHPEMAARYHQDVAGVEAEILQQFRATASGGQAAGSASRR